MFSTQKILYKEVKHLSFFPPLSVTRVTTDGSHAYLFSFSVCVRAYLPACMSVRVKFGLKDIVWLLCVAPNIKPYFLGLHGPKGSYSPPI